MTMPQTKGYDIKGNRVIFRENRHCIHNHMVKKKQGKKIDVKLPQSSRVHDINCG
ncbi:5469_t:CDS:2 [Funneliformis mosseae]|uniref:5469_t:CDS:1 n=1 Tax=Funneliformis mosseae TaxID=27381 RepID=A0A9N9FT14_FUNMO|nr:5469_t:CDS:2 [Funneliformis mosseae]